MVKDQYYFDECMPLLEKALTEMNTETEDYSAVYPLARKLAYALAQGVVAGRLQSVDSVIQMCRLGREFPLGTLLTQLMNSKNSLCF
jgi:transposase